MLHYGCSTVERSDGLLDRGRSAVGRRDGLHNAVERHDGLLRCDHSVAGSHDRLRGRNVVERRNGLPRDDHSAVGRPYSLPGRDHDTVERHAGLLYRSADRLQGPTCRERTVHHDLPRRTPRTAAVIPMVPCWCTPMLCLYITHEYTVAITRQNGTRRRKQK